MSRSFKKVPQCCDYSRKRTRFYKRQANKKVRKKQWFCYSGRSYKKIYESWDIFDQKSLMYAEHENQGYINHKGEFIPSYMNRENEKKARRK